MGMRRRLAQGVAGLLGVSGATAYYYRPQPDKEDGDWTRPPWSSPRQLVDAADEEESPLMKVGGNCAFLVCEAMCRLLGEQASVAHTPRSCGGGEDALYI
jgi:hypothetical protein